MPAPHHVLFLCTGNSARSVFAECLLGRLGAGRFVAHSAGSHPKGAVHPRTLELLRELGYATAHLRSKSWDEFAAPGAPRLDFVFTVCDDAAEEPCPLWPGQPITAHWGVPDPAAVRGTDREVRRAFRLAFARLEHRVRLFTALPLGQLGPLALREQLVAIGKSTGDADSPA